MRPYKTQHHLSLLQHRICCQGSACPLGVVNSRFVASFPPLFLSAATFAVSAVGFLGRWVRFCTSFGGCAVIPGDAELLLLVWTLSLAGGARFLPSLPGNLLQVPNFSSLLTTTSQLPYFPQAFLYLKADFCGFFVFFFLPA